MEEVDIRGVPARLIRRDPETQAVVTRERALGGGWRDLGVSALYWGEYIEYILECGDPDVVLVAPKAMAGKWMYRNLLEGLRLLREAGIAEPD